MPSEPRPTTLFEIGELAVQTSDPADADPCLGELLAQFEDADEPVTAIEKRANTSAFGRPTMGSRECRSGTNGASTESAASPPQGGNQDSRRSDARLAMEAGTEWPRVRDTARAC
jgi:hypothetical protein